MADTEKHDEVDTRSYEVLASLDVSDLDILVPLDFGPDFEFRPISLRLLIFYFSSGFALFYIISHTFIPKGGIISTALFVLLWVILTMLLATPDALGVVNYERLADVASWLSKRARSVACRLSDNAGNFASICAVKKEVTDGVFLSNDGMYQCVFSVVGNASLLLFQSDANAVVDRVDTFWCVVRPDVVDYVFITDKEAQKTYSQIGAYGERMDNLQDKCLLDLCEKKIDSLMTDVAYQQSIHQYMILRAKSMEELQREFAHLESECATSAMMFSRVTQLFGDDALHVFDMYIV